MNVTLTSLEALILKATNENLPCPDPAALEAFCAVMRDSTEGPQLAAQALAARVHAANAREALLTLSMLDRCMRRGDTNFQAEVGKFRFLNEMIKLVSPKYFADRTDPEVRTRVLQLFHAWSIEYPKESKFKVAYDMLRNQGVIRETPPPLPPEDDAPRPPVKSAIFEDDEKSKLLQKLLQSKKPEDLQHANRLIKNMVKEEERRSEECSRRAAETEGALASGYLLQEMLAHIDELSDDEMDLLKDVHANCQRQRPVLQRLAASNGDQGDNLDDIIQASDLLDEVLESYKSFLNGNKGRKPAKVTGGNTDQTNGDSLLDLASGDSDTQRPKEGRNAMDELGDIFAVDCRTTAIAEPLKPVTSSFVPQDDTNLLLTGNCEGKTERAEGWNELDSLGEQLLRQSLPGHARRGDGFNSKPAKKIPMNALEKSSPKHENPNANNSLLDFDFFTKKSEEEPSEPAPEPPVVVDKLPEAPMTAYQMWVHSNNHFKFPNIPGLRLADGPYSESNWKALDPSERNVWEVKAAAAKEQYEKDLEAYNSSKGMELVLSTGTKPKRTMLAYLIFVNSVRERYEVQTPGLRESEIAVIAGKLWKKEDKKMWERIAADPTNQYDKMLLEDIPGTSYQRVRHVPLVQDDDNEDFDDKPKRPLSAYRMWLASAKGAIRADNPGITKFEIAKKGEKIWRELKDKSIWEKKAAVAKEQYYKDLMEWEGKEFPLPRTRTSSGSQSDTMLDISMGPPAPAKPGKRKTVETGYVESSAVPSLQDISVSVASVRPSGVPPLPIWEGSGLKVTLHFCQDQPKRGVSVIVVSTTNYTCAAIEDYKFSAVVPKSCKIRLLPASATTLPPHNVFAPAAVTQVMLIGRPASLPPVTLKFAIVYACDDEMVSEKGVVEALPLPNE